MRSNGCECVKTQNETEVCDTKDNNCDGQTDDVENADQQTYQTVAVYIDRDGDGFGDAQASASTTPPGIRYLCGPMTKDGQSYVTNNSDCNDGDTTVHPNAPELCDGQLNDCTSTTGIPSDEVDHDNDQYLACTDYTAPRAPSDIKGGGDCAPGPDGGTISPESDLDGDHIFDCQDPCVDQDHDGLGDGRVSTAQCPGGATPDTDPTDPSRCADTDQDGCDDCALGLFNPSNDGTDEDRDGIGSTGRSRHRPAHDCDAR